MFYTSISHTSNGFKPSTEWIVIWLVRRLAVPEPEFRELGVVTSGVAQVMNVDASSFAEPHRVARVILKLVVAERVEQNCLEDEIFLFKYFWMCFIWLPLFTLFYLLWYIERMDKKYLEETNINFC